MIFEVEYLRDDLPGLVGSALALKQLRHRSLPTRIDLGTRHPFLRDGKIIGFRLADQEAIVAQEE